jgi:hypothetical protein
VLSNAHFVDWGLAKHVTKDKNGKNDAGSATAIVSFFFSYLSMVNMLIIMSISTEVARRPFMVSPDELVGSKHISSVAFTLYVTRRCKVIYVISELIIESCDDKRVLCKLLGYFLN